MEFMIDDKGVLWVGSMETGFACTGMPCKQGEEQAVWDSIPDGPLPVEE